MFWRGNGESLLLLNENCGIFLVVAIPNFHLCSFAGVLLHVLLQPPYLAIGARGNGVLQLGRWAQVIAKHIRHQLVVNLPGL